MMAYLNYIHVAFQPMIFILGFSSLFRKYKVINQKEYDILINFVYFSIIIGLLFVFQAAPLTSFVSYFYSVTMSVNYLCTTWTCRYTSYCCGAPIAAPPGSSI